MTSDSDECLKDRDDSPFIRGRAQASDAMLDAGSLLVNHQSLNVLIIPFL